MAANKQASIHTHVHNAVTLVWGSLRFIPIILKFLPEDGFAYTRRMLASYNLGFEPKTF